MHECLLLEDILYNIFEHVRENWSKDRDRTLLALATTCRAFCEPALDQLYYILPSVHPIIRCLPRDVWGIRRKPGQTRDLLLIKKPLEAHHWNTISKYSRRVRSLWITFSVEELEVYIALSKPPDSSCLFPHLRVLNWRCDSSDASQVQQMIPFLRFTLRPSLRAVFLELSDTTLRTYADLHSIGTRCPNLQTLDVMRTHMSSSTDELICSCRSLWRLSTGRVSEKSFHSIATSSYLRSLTLILDWVERDESEDRFQLWKRRCNTPIFPSLQDLSLQAFSSSTVASFLQLKRWAIRRLSISVLVLKINAASRDHLFSLIHTRFDHDRLERVMISGNARNMEDSPVVNHQTFLPLMAFTNLTRVMLFSVMVLAIDDNALERVAQAWPRLQTLIIKQEAGRYTCPNITLRGLALLLKHCPDLSDLSISINASVSILPTDFSLPQNTRITRVNFNHSPITHPAQVAVVLSSMMPRLRAVLSWPLIEIPVEISYELVDQWRQMWKAVDTSVRESRKIGGT